MCISDIINAGKGCGGERTHIAVELFNRRKQRAFLKIGYRKKRRDAFIKTLVASERRRDTRLTSEIKISARIKTRLSLSLSWPRLVSSP